MFCLKRRCSYEIFLINKKIFLKYEKEPATHHVATKNIKIKYFNEIKVFVCELNVTQKL